MATKSELTAFKNSFRQDRSSDGIEVKEDAIEKAYKVYNTFLESNVDPEDVSCQEYARYSKLNIPTYYISVNLFSAYDAICIDIDDKNITFFHEHSRENINKKKMHNVYYPFDELLNTIKLAVKVS